MNEALAIFLGRRLTAAAAEREPGSLRLACPECMESVYLVRKAPPFFSHYPRGEGSPHCSLRAGRTVSSPSQISVESADNRLSDQKVFRRALLDRYRLAGLPALAPEETEAWSRKVKFLRMMHPTLQRSSIERAVRKILLTPSLLQSGLRDSFVEPSLKTSEHVQVVTLLWDHLYLRQVEDDMMFLLRLADLSPLTLIRAPENQVAAFILRPLAALSWVPWLDIARLEGQNLLERLFE